MAAKRKKSKKAVAPAATPRAAAPAPARAAVKVNARTGKREYALLAELPKIPFYKLKRDGTVLTRPKQTRDKETGDQIIIDEKVLYDQNGELQHRNRWGEVLMYEMTLHKREKAPDPLQVTVNDRRYAMVRGKKMIVPWFVVHHFRVNIESKYRQEPHPTLPGRKQTVTEQMHAENTTARPIDPCDDFDDETAHLPQRPFNDEEGETASGDPGYTLEPVVPLPGPVDDERPLVARRAA